MEFRDNIQEPRATIRNIESGVSQGFVIAPLMFNICVSDITKILNKIVQFIDDTVIYILV